MKKILVAFVFLCCSLAWGSVPPAPVNISAIVGSTTAATTTSTLAYVPTAGNTVVLAIGTNGPPGGTTCQDSGAVSMTIVAGVTNGSHVTLFYYTAGPGVTGFTCSWVTLRAYAFVVIEYSLVGAVNAVPSPGTSTGATSPATISPVSTLGNDLMVAAFVRPTTTTWGTSTGTLRVSGGNTSVSIAVVDNTTATPATTVTEAATLSPAGNWPGVVVELLPITTSLGSKIMGRSKIVGSGEIL